MAKQTIDELAVVITANSERIPRDLAKAKKEFDKFVQDVAATSPRPPKPPDMAGLRQAAREAAGVRSAARAAMADVAAFAGKAAVAGGSLLAVEAGLSGMAGVFEQVKQSVRMAADLEQTTVGFEVMLGSAQRAKDMLADIRQYAATTPFNNRELTAAARQLVAYGFAGEDVLGTLKRLGDVSSAVQKPIGELAYLYGTLRTQGRAYTRDINQFTTAGIDVYPALSGVLNKPQHEIKGLVEEGRVEFRDVEEAFKRMTSEGGRYFGMTARQGQTLAGVLEQTADAFDLLKLEFGKVLVEELGIKDAARDMEGFAGRLREGVGELRPAVKLAGQLARSGAQIAYEFTRAGAMVARLNLNAYADALPGAAELKKVLDGMANFKLDKREVIDFAFTFGEAMAANVVQLGRDVGNFGEGLVGLFEWAVRSAKQARDYMKETADWITNINSAAVTKLLVSPILPVAARIATDIANPLPGNRRDGAPVNPAWDMPAPLPGMSAGRIRREYKELSDYLSAQEVLLAHHQGEVAAGRGNPVTVELFRAKLADAHRFRAGYEEGFAPPPGQHAGEMLRAGNVPPVRGAAPDAEFWSQLQAGFGNARNVFQALGRWDVKDVRASLRRVRDEMMAVVDAEEKVLNEAAARIALFGPAGLFKPVPPRPSGQASPDALVALGGPAGLFRVGDPRQELNDLATHLRKEYDPRPELDAYRRQLDEIGWRNLLGPDTRAFTDRAWRDRLGEVAGKMGLDPAGRYHLPEATAVGTAEDARLVTAWQTQGENKTGAERLLQMILDEIQRQTRAAEQAPRQIGREVGREVGPPRVMALPGE